MGKLIIIGIILALLLGLGGLIYLKIGRTTNTNKTDQAGKKESVEKVMESVDEELNDLDKELNKNVEGDELDLEDLSSQ